jgi:probable phosphoglycerate mutase
LRIFLARHGETELNLQGLLQGRRDSALTAKGVAHAEKLGDWLANTYDRARPLAVWSSPLGRAQRTAEIALSRAGVDLPIRIDERLVEIDGGSLEGLSRRNVIAMVGNVRESDVLLLRSVDGERYQDVSSRLSAWLSDRAKECGDHLVIGHAGSGRVMRAVYAGADPESLAAMSVAHTAIFKLENGEISEVQSQT